MSFYNSVNLSANQNFMNEQINNRYQLEAEIGSGGMGTVYRAYDRLSNTQVALKRVHIITDTPVYSDSQTIQGSDLALANEFRTLATLRHPHIISVLDYGFDSQTIPYFTMTLLENKLEFLEATWNLPLDEQVSLFNQMFLALVYLHQRGIIHRDIKPANVLVSEEQVKVLDFGLSIKSKDNKSRAGTIQYMAPETLARGITLASSDLYASGVILHQAITGKMPYETVDIQNRVETPVSMEHMQGHPLEGVIAKLLEINPEDRYQSADAVIKAINAATQTTALPETEAIIESFLQTAAFVGRDTEIEQLEAALNQESSMWLVGGESGAGKSRLIEEVRVRALVSGRLVIQGQAVQGETMPYEQWRSIVRRLCLSADLDDWTAGVLKDLVPDIDNLLNRSIEAAPRLSGSSYQERLASAIETLIQQQSLPLLLIFEDLQWAEENLPPLQHMVSVIETLSDVMMIGTYRDEEAPQLPEDLPGAELLNLSRLDEHAIVELSAAMLGHAGTQQPVIDLMKRETDGNIFFMVEVARALAEDAGALTNIGRVTLPEQVFTGNMQRILDKRVHKLDEKHHPVLHFAAIYGRQINLELLYSVFEADMVDDWLYTCETLAILFTRHNEWLFIHDKIRDAILFNLEDAEKESIHGQVASAIEQLYPGDVTYNEVLLEHWHLANNLDKEIAYMNRVAEGLIRINGDYEKSRRLLKRTLDALPDRDKHRISLLNYLAECQWESGNIGEAESISEQALSLATAHDMLLEQAASHMMLGQTLRIRDKYDDAVFHTEKALSIYRQFEDKRGISYSLYVLGNNYARRGDYPAAGEYFEQSLAIAREINAFRVMSICLEELGMVMRVRRNIDQAIVYTQESLDISTRLGDKRGIALKLNSLGRVLRDNKQYDLAEEKLAESLLLLQQLKDTYGSAWSAYNLGLIVQTREDYLYARTLTEASLETYEALQDKYGIAICVNSLGFIELATDKIDEAIQQFCRAIRIGEEAAIPALSLTGIVGLAIILHQSGDNKRASELLRLANYHPSSNTEVYFRLANLPAGLEVADNDSALLDYDSTVDELLAEFSSDE